MSDITACALFRDFSRHGVIGDYRLQLKSISICTVDCNMNHLSVKRIFRDIFPGLRRAYLRLLQTISENSFIWRPKRLLVTLLNL